MFRNIDEWTISPNSNYYHNVWFIHSSGVFSSYDAIISYGVRPVFFLNQSTTLSGLGTSLDPYKIMD